MSLVHFDEILVICSEMEKGVDELGFVPEEWFGFDVVRQVALPRTPSRNNQPNTHCRRVNEDAVYLLRYGTIQ